MLPPSVFEPPLAAYEAVFRDMFWGIPNSDTYLAENKVEFQNMWRPPALV